jgi:hypothetical protein
LQWKDGNVNVLRNLKPQNLSEEQPIFQMGELSAHAETGKIFYSFKLFGECGEKAPIKH